MNECKILYNVTIKIDQDVEEDWLKWMKSAHIPEVLETKCFLSSRLNKLLFLNDEEGSSYSIQYLAKDMKSLQQYMGSYAPKLQEDLNKRYKDKFVAFRSIMEVLEDFR